MEPPPSFPPSIPVATIARWLPEIFPEGTPNRTYLVREMAAKTLFTMLYVGAVEGADRWLRPDQVTKMTDLQAAETDQKPREKWAAASLRSGQFKDLQGRWYAVNTREPIRDETLRSGLVAVGAVVERQGLPTTSSLPRYAIAAHFSALLSALAQAEASLAPSRIREWQSRHLTAGALGRINLLRSATVLSGPGDRLKVTFPNGETRLMIPGPSSVITRAVMEEFAPRFLRLPGVIFLSESGNKVVLRDDDLARRMGLHIDYSRHLPDIILADGSPDAWKLVFVEVVATDGPISEQRKKALLAIAVEAGFEARNVYFLSAFLDRASSAFKKAMPELAWGSYAWFASEPDKLLAMCEGQPEELSKLFS